MSYQDQLRDPRWQKKRLEILERDEWTCQRCLDTKTTLTVHHKSYIMESREFRDVWDYPCSYLVTLCEHCHSDEEKRLKELQKLSFFSLREFCNNAETIDGLLLLLKFIALDKVGRITLDDVARIHSFCVGDKNE